MEPDEETLLLKAIEKMLDDYLKSGFFSVWSLPENSEYDKRIKEKLEQVSQRLWSERSNDPLTDVWSRHLIFRLLQDALSILDFDTYPRCLAYIDIDKMKHINDYYGLPNGDTALIRLANTLKQTLHPVHWVGRIGGDEFLCLFNCDLQEAKRLTEQLQESLKGLVIVDDSQEVRATFKIGLTALKNGDTPVSCLRRLEDAIHNIGNQLVIV